MMGHHKKFLDLRNNTIKYVNSNIADVPNKSISLKKMWLSGNPIECECSNRDFLLFMLTKYEKIPYFTAIKCSNNIYFTMTSLTLTITNLCSKSLINNSSYYLVIIVVTVLLAITCIAIALYYKFSHNIKVFLFSKSWFLCLYGEEELDKDKVYDAFISFSRKDEDFVVNELLPELEKEPSPFKICIHYRNWVAGEFIPVQIEKSVKESRRTVIVLSPNFFESVWGKMEFCVAYSNDLREGRTRVIVILYGDIGAMDKLDPELQAYLIMNTYVKWGDPWFWHNLRYALPHPSSNNSLISRSLDRPRLLEDQHQRLQALQALNNPVMGRGNSVPINI